MRKIIIGLLLLTGCIHSAPSKMQINQCMDDCAINRVTCEYDSNYCNTERTKCEKNCK